MCRFVVYHGPAIRLASLISDPANSLIHQSFDSKEREEPLNGDGFGIAWYVPQIQQSPAVFRSISPAWSNRNLRHLADVTESRTVLAHVRAATPGLPVTETNTHPFSWRRYAFMHNGQVGGFAKIKRKLRNSLSDEVYQMIEGSTDSEHLFGLFAEHVCRHGEPATAQGLAAALKQAVREVIHMAEVEGVTEPHYLNLAVSDGARSAVCRVTTDEPGSAPSLYLHTGKRYSVDRGVTRMLDAASMKSRSAIVASEPLSNEPGWEKVPENGIVVIEENGSVSHQEAVA